MAKIVLNMLSLFLAILDADLHTYCISTLLYDNKRLLATKFKHVEMTRDLIISDLIAYITNLVDLFLPISPALVLIRIPRSRTPPCFAMSFFQNHDQDYNSSPVLPNFEPPALNEHQNPARNGTLFQQPNAAYNDSQVTQNHRF